MPKKDVRRFPFVPLIALLTLAGSALAHPESPAGATGSAPAASADAAVGTPSTAAAASADGAPPDPVAAAAAEANDWIRPADVNERAELLAHRLEARQPGETTITTIEHIESGMSRLDSELDAGFEQARVALTGRTSLVAIQDAHRELRTVSDSLPEWTASVDTEILRVSAVLDEIAATRRRWVRTLERPEIDEAGEATVRRANGALEQIDAAVAGIQTWKERLRTLHGALDARATAISDATDQLAAATGVASRNLVVPDYPPIWRRDLGAQLAREWPHVPERFADLRRKSVEYFRDEPRPLVLQVVVALVLMLVLRRLPPALERRQASAGRDASPQSLFVLQRPYSIAFLLALTATPALHPNAPTRIGQLVALLALIPVARILSSGGRSELFPVFGGLLVLFALDRSASAVASLPATAFVVFVVELLVALGVAFFHRRRLAAQDGNHGLRLLLTLAIWIVGAAILAEIGGWTSLSSLVGRGIVVAGTSGLLIYASTISVEALWAFSLASPFLRRSRFVDRNQALVQRWSSTTIRVLGLLLWLRTVVNAMGLGDATADATAAFLGWGVSVGALSLSVGGFLSFGFTLVVALFISRLIHELLEDEILPRANFPRGIPNVLLALSNYAVWSLGFLLALAAAGVQLGQLSIMIGGLGVGIGLGLQDVVKNFAAGLTLLFERRVHVGDAVEIPEKNVFGRVLEIGMRASVVRNWNGTEVVMPNDDLVSASVTNWTLSDRIHRIEVEVGVAYGTDPETVLALLLEVAETKEYVLANPAPTALFTGFGDSSLNFRLRAWNEEEYERNAVRKSELAVAVCKALRDAGITIPFPQRDLHLASISEQAGAALRPAGAET